jgi:hypothetical protein
LLSCNDSSVVDDKLNVDVKQQELNNLLTQLGFDTQKIKDTGDYLVYDNDLVLTKSDLLTRIAHCGDTSSYKNARLDQWVVNTDGVVDWSRAGNITYSIDASVNTMPQGADWTNAIRQALNDWTNVGDDNVNFTETTNANIMFFTDNTAPLTCMRTLPATVFASAQFPSGGRIGNSVSINDNGPTSNLGGKLWVIRHEVGHAMGFRHSDWYNRGGTGVVEDINSSGCGNPVYGANLLPRTLSSDANSVFNSMATGFNDINFSNDDRRSIRKLYPNALVAPQIGSVSLASAKGAQYYLNFSNLDDKASQIIVYAEKYVSYKPLTAQFSYYQTFTIPANSSQLIVSFASIPFAGRFYCTVKNYKGDLESAKSPIYTTP